MLPLSAVPTVITLEIPPEANPEESDMMAMNSLPFRIGTVVEKVP